MSIGLCILSKKKKKIGLCSLLSKKKKLDSVAHFGVQQVVLNPVPQSLFKTGLSSNGQ